MPLISDADRVLYRPLDYEKEADFEKVVISLSDAIFGPSTIYVDVKKRMSGKIVSIPDGYLIDMTEADEPKLFIVENEIVRHDPFRHIGIQMLKFATSFEDVQTELKNFLMDEIARSPEQMKRLEEACSKSSKRNVDNYLDCAVYGTFRGLVIIDEATDALHNVLEKIAANISVLELRSFGSDDGSIVHQFDTLYDEFEESVPDTTSAPVSADERRARRQRRARSDTIIVPAREEGFRQTFLGKNQWHAIRISPAMKDRIKYIAAYQIRPVSAVTHIAEVKDIRPYGDTGKYVVIFAGPAEELRRPIPIGNPNHSPQGPVYAEKEVLLASANLEDALT